MNAPTVPAIRHAATFAVFIPTPPRVRSAALIHAPQLGTPRTVVPHALLPALFASLFMPAPVCNVLGIGDGVALEHPGGEPFVDGFYSAGQRITEQLQR